MATWLPTGIQLSYLVAAALFILGIKKLGSPATARGGNLWAAVGMTLAIVATLLDQHIVGYGQLAAALAVGSALGALMAYRVEMTAMPQMVGLLNGLGGGASALVALAEFWRASSLGITLTPETLVSILLGVGIGGVTLTGSLIAFGKLQEWLTGAPVTFVGQRLMSVGLVVGFALGCAYLLVVEPTDLGVLLALTLVTLVFGVLFVIPVGGADMPVVVSLLNSLSGLAASATGFILANNMLVVAGALVGASGLILTQIMCKAMNRPLTNVLFGAFTVQQAGTSTGAAGLQGSMKTVDSEETAMMLAYARSVVIVPGYGLAVAQAQHAVRELADQLEHRGVDVRYAIHPVAGRMPGHMNVLLAEANVPYPQLYDMEGINPEFERTDVALVIGANDVVNPAARHDKGSPIYGMPILDVDRAQRTVVIKRGAGRGYSGIENELFFKDKTLMLYGNARDVLTQLVSTVKQLD